MLMSLRAWSQFSTGMYVGEIRAIATDFDMQGQEQLANLDFTVYAKPGFTRCNFMVPQMGYIVVMLDSVERHEVTYFEIAGNKKALHRIWSESDSVEMGTEGFHFERGSFECMDGDTVIAGQKCKRARWYSASGQEPLVEVWYAEAIPNAMPQRYVHLPGMPMQFVYRENGITMQYRVTRVEFEMPSPELFEPLQDHEALWPNQETIDQEKR